MKVLLDTCVVSDYVKGHADTHEQLLLLKPTDVAISSITEYELYYGLKRNPALAAKLYPVISTLLDAIVILPVDSQVANHAAALRSHLEKQGKPIGSYDILIAATALAYDLTLISSNEREFERVNGMKLSNWRKSA